MKNPHYGNNHNFNIGEANSVTSIGKYAFELKIGEANIAQPCIPEPPTCQSNTFYNASTSTCVLYVPLGTTEAYSEATGWEDFLNIVEVEFNTELYHALYDELKIGEAKYVSSKISFLTLGTPFKQIVPMLLMIQELATMLSMMS